MNYNYKQLKIFQLSLKLMEKKTSDIMIFDGKPRIKTIDDCGKEVFKACLGVVEYIYEQDSSADDIIKESLLMLRDDMKEVFYLFIN